VDAECDKLDRRPSSYVNGMFITLSVKLCLPHDAREAARRAGPSTTADTSSLSPVNEYSVQGHFTDVGLTEARSLKTVSAKALLSTTYRPGDSEMICPTDGSSTRGGSTSVRGRVRSPHMAKLQAASVPIAYGSCAPRAGTDTRTGRRTDRGIA